MRCKIPANDLSQRLNETICRYDGKAVRVRYAGGHTLQLLNPHNGGEVALINSDDPKLDISSVPQGYVQLLPSCVVYASRKPLRMYKQGTTNECLSIEYMTPSKRNLARLNVFSKSFADMVDNKYPSFEKAFELLKIKEHDDDKTTEIAISRDIALKRIHKLELIIVYFKKVEVGFIAKDSNTIVTPSDQMGWIISKHLSQFSWKVE